MTHFKALLLGLAFFSILFSSHAQNGLNTNSFASPDTSEPYLFAADQAFGVKAGVGYVQDGDFSFCIGGGFRMPIGETSLNNKRFIAEAEAVVDLRTLGSDGSRFNRSSLQITPGIKRICGFSDRVNMGGGLSLPIGFGRSTNRFDGNVTRSDNILGRGTL
ncbi:MAG: hypothetical protein AAF696_08565 [Bacteroidota bacterium]